MEIYFCEESPYKHSRTLMEMEDSMFMSGIRYIEGMEIYTGCSFLDNPPFYFRLFKYLTWQVRDAEKNNIFLPHNNKICRISMTEPKYLGYEKEDLILTKKELKDLIEYLKNVPNETREEYKGWTNWRWQIEITNDIYSTYDGRRPIPEDLPMPDYTLLPTID